LRAKGLAVELLLSTLKARRAFAEADRAGAARVFLIGPDELARKSVRVKELASGAEHEEPLERFAGVRERGMVAGEG